MGEQQTAVVMLAGPIKYWWDENWGTPLHELYVAWRQYVSDLLVEAGYLIYRPHEAFKGRWTEQAQSVNDAALRLADVAVILTPPGVPSLGTDSETHYASQCGAVLLPAPPPTTELEFETAGKEVLRQLEALGVCRPVLDQQIVQFSLVINPETVDWLLPAFLRRYKNAVMRPHYIGDDGHIRSVDAARLRLSGGQPLARVRAVSLSGARLSILISQLLKVEALAIV